MPDRDLIAEARRLAAHSVDEQPLMARTRDVLAAVTDALETSRARIAELERENIRLSGIEQLHAEAGRRVIVTTEQLDALDFPCLIREIPHADEPVTDDFYPQIWELGFQTGWCRAGAMFRVKDCTPMLPVEVLVEPEVNRG